MTARPNLDRTFAALADPTRRAILVRLVAGDRVKVELSESDRSRGRIREIESR